MPAFKEVPVLPMGSPTPSEKKNKKPCLFSRLFSRKREEPAPPPSPSFSSIVRDGVVIFSGPEMEKVVQKAGFQVVSDPWQAFAAVAIPDRAMFAPSELPLLIVRIGAASDILIAACHPNARLVSESEIFGELRVLFGESEETSQETLRLELEETPRPKLEEPQRTEPKEINYPEAKKHSV